MREQEQFLQVLDRFHETADVEMAGRKVQMIKILGAEVRARKKFLRKFNRDTAQVHAIDVLFAHGTVLREQPEHLALSAAQLQKARFRFEFRKQSGQEKTMPWRQVQRAHAIQLVVPGRLFGVDCPPGALARAW